MAMSSTRTRWTPIVSRLAQVIDLAEAVERYGRKRSLDTESTLEGVEMIPEVDAACPDAEETGGPRACCEGSRREGARSRIRKLRLLRARLEHHHRSAEVGLAGTYADRPSLSAFLASPSYLVSVAADSTLRIWDPDSGAFRHTLTAQTGAITCFQHDDFKVLSGSDDTLKMWNISDGTVVCDLLTGISGVWQVVFEGRCCVAARN
ncbi:hypothetical protein GGF50DRAFT_118424 [Schizophyllum commune]